MAEDTQHDELTSSLPGLTSAIAARVQPATFESARAARAEQAVPVRQGLMMSRGRDVTYRTKAPKEAATVLVLNYHGARHANGIEKNARMRVLQKRRSYSCREKKARMFNPGV
jgi:hypothetical protein